MADGHTTNYGFIIPDRPSTNTWGTKLDDNFESLDTVIKGVADAALPIEGGTLTGPLKTVQVSYARADLGSVASGTATADLTDGAYFTLTVGGAIAVAFSNVPAAVMVPVIFKITNGGSSITWPASVKWPGGAAPTLTASGVDVIAGFTDDGGTTWRLNLAQRDSR